ncbi:glycerate kinase type-2 family protein [Rhodoplanes sp. Z2-YC6860]|uniref:glycerate kinase type-2 family protein n=1 Tax=Rhodoplanes sp. Z2-YC6860 TaxID=674703 RepID=UPI00078C9B82|nr:glycerate kinase [Rhodoplanes sp. Z2-YC6860]AMN40212.1 D-glycerate 2-kinase [Rhodoplanes sp. Z2-YC6860]
MTDRAITDRDFLDGLFRTAIAAAHPSSCLPPHLPPPPTSGRLIVLAAGKAAGAMTEVAEQHYLGRGKFPVERLTGVAVARHGYGRPSQKIEMIEAGHPVPDAAGLAAAQKALALADQATADDLVLVLLSGGASANWIAPVEGLSFADKQAVTRALLRSGANIGEINTLRKHLSRIKGGRLARHAQPARVLTLAISDVPGDEPAVIGSGPTVPDPSTLADARAIVQRHRLALPEAATRALSDERNESPKPGDPAFAHSDYKLIARPADAFRAVESSAQKAGYETVMLGDRVEGEARIVAAEHAARALALQKAGRRAVILSGGELTVTIRGQGRGGPNQEYALALAMALHGAPGIAALAGDTDGTDGGAGSADDPAGARIDQTTLERARLLGLDPAHFLSDNDSTGFFTRIGDLIETGPTCTNVNDFRAIVVDSP